jgi:endoplasmic reticulum protein 29
MASNVGMMVCLGVLLCMLLGGVHATHTKGVIPLDSLTFDKVVDGSKPVLVKFDKAYPEGGKEDAFQTFAKAMASTTLIIGEVNIKDTGEKCNDDLRKRFNLKMDDLPVYKLFMEGKLTEPLTYTGEMVRDDVLQWLEEEAGVWVGLKGRLKAFDAIAIKLNKQMVSIEDALSEARTKATELKDEAQMRSAALYIQIMEKIKENMPGHKATLGEKISGKVQGAKETLQGAKDTLQEKYQDAMDKFTDKMADAKDSMSEARENIMSVFRFGRKKGNKEDL